MWIDSHAHLADLNDCELAAALRQATDARVGIVVATATDIKTSRIVTQQCGRFPMLRGAAGISPFDVTDPPATWYEDLTALLGLPGIIAAGEIGIDTGNPRYPPLSLQQPMFEKQLALARSLDLPVIVHSRGAEKRAVDICKSIGVSTALFHCFTGSREALAAILDNGYYVSISGIVTFPGNALRGLAAYIPLDRLLIETDTPYLAPVPHRGKKNCPAWVRLVGEELARLRGIGEIVLQQKMEENFRRLFAKGRNI